MMSVKELREKLLGDVDYTDIKNILAEFEQGIREELLVEKTIMMGTCGSVYTSCKTRIHVFKSLLGDD